MKKILTAFLLASACLANAQKPFKMEATIEGADPSIKKYYISVGMEGEYNKYKEVDSVEVKNGKFTYTTNVKGIVMAQLSASRNRAQRISVFFAEGETLKLTIKGREYFYDGSKFYKECDGADQVFTKLQKDVDDYYNSARKILAETPEEQQAEKLKPLQDTLNMLSAKYREGVIDYLKKHPAEEGAIVYSLNSLSSNIVYEQLTEQAKASRAGKYVKMIVDYNAKLLEEQAKAAAEEEARINALIGSPAKDFTLKDIKGNDLSLSSLRGKYVLLDFWGSWCGWCIKGIPDMKKYYEKYAGKYEILGVDCNDTEEAWKNAVEKYELPWLHVYNPRTSSVVKDYGITGYPTKIMIDAEGKIAKIIIGEDPAFYDYLDELFGK